MTRMSRRLRRPLDRSMLLVSLGFALGMVLIVFGLFSATTGRDAQGLPDEVEQISPARGDSVLRQTEIVADLAPGYTGELVIDGVALPVVEIQATLTPDPSQDATVPLTTRFDPGSNVLRYLPQDGAPIPRFEQGTHDVSVVFWRIDEGRERARSYSWQFDVSI
jgi:hypothetical protein